jgi:hypothetical protein
VTWAGVRVLEEILRGEVVYSTLGVVMLALILATGRVRAPLPVSPAR